MNYTKASVFLRTVGNSKGYHALNNDSYVAISASNFNTLEQGYNHAIYMYEAVGALSKDVMQIFAAQANATYPKFNYVIKATKAAKYYVYLRVNANSTHVNTVNIYLDDIQQSETTVSLMGNDWIWIQSEIVIKDNLEHKVGVQFTGGTLNFDSLVITNADNLPAQLQYATSFQTIHAKILALDANTNVVSSLPFYDYKTTIDEIVADNWYNFAIEPLAAYSSVDFTSKFAFCLFVSGSDEENYVMWDFGDDAVIDENIRTGVYLLDTVSNNYALDFSNYYALRLFSFYDSIDVDNKEINIPPAKLINKRVEVFDNVGLKPKFLQTKIVDVDASSNKVALNLNSRLVSVIIDQSGSQTWNDNQGLRHNLAKEMVDRLQATYPGEIRYNLMTYGGIPININFFAVVESDEINTNNVAAVSQSFFSDQESGYAGVRIVRNQNNFPTNPLDGDVIYEGFSNKVLDSNLEENQTYYYAAYVYNANGEFSSGKFLSATPRSRILPRNVGDFSFRVLVGTGRVKRDSNVVGLWHLNEATENRLFDFSDSNLILTTSQSGFVWLNKNNVPDGVSGLRLDGSTYFSGFDASNSYVHEKFSLSAWVKPFNFATQRTLVAREDVAANKLTFRLGIDTDGKMYFTLDGVTIAKSSEPLLENVWQHIFVNVDTLDNTANFYIDGLEAGVGIVTKGAAYSEDALSIFLGGQQNCFLGSVADLSIHNTIRPESYIADIARYPETPSDKILDNGDRLVVLYYTVADDFNFEGGTVKILRKAASGNANFELQDLVGGETSQTRIILNGYGESVNNDTDGFVVHDVMATKGQRIVSLPYDYNLDWEYYFRVYTYNVLGNVCSDTDAQELKIQIPNFENIAEKNKIITTSLLPQIENLASVAGNAKSYLTWEQINSNSNVSQVLIFWSDRATPILDSESQSSNSSILVFRGEPNSFEFVDRNIENSYNQYYAIVTADKYGNYSTAVYTTVVPEETALESGIPLLEVKKFNYQLVNNNTLSITWNSPVQFQKDIDAYFDERVVLYAEVTDEFGEPLSDLGDIAFAVQATYSQEDLADDKFNRTDGPVDFVVEQTYVITSTILGNGVIKGTFRMTDDAKILSSLNYLYASVTVNYKIPNKTDPTSPLFEINSKPIKIRTLNPFQMQIINIGTNNSCFGDPSAVVSLRKRSRRRSSNNLDQLNEEDSIDESATACVGDKVPVLCKKSIDLNSRSFLASEGQNYDTGREKIFDGSYIRRNRPFVARVIVSYKGEALPIGNNCTVGVFEANDPECDALEEEERDPCSAVGTTPTRRQFIPVAYDTISRTVQPPATSIEFQIGQLNLANNRFAYVSYVDVPLQSPDFPQAVMLYAKTSYANITAIRKFYIVFATILRIETTTEQPESNCIDVAEQRAFSYLIDPNSPNARTPNRLRLPENVVCKWEIKKSISGQDRPFYSNDNVPIAPGVFSYFRGGTARKVFFGPACAVQFKLYTPCPQYVLLLPEIYAVRATVTYDGLQAFDEKPIIIYPPNVNNNGVGNRFLLNFDNYYNVIYSDGYAYLKATIYHNPANAESGPFGACFLQCLTDAGRPIFVLDNNQIVRIETGDEFEIIHGDDVALTYDADLEETIITGGQTDIGYAEIVLSQDRAFTNFYIRINKQVQETEPQTFDNNNPTRLNPCLCFDFPPGLAKKQGLKFIRGSTTLAFEDAVLYLQGGGNFTNGIPPTAVELREPLALYFRGIKRNNRLVENFVCDGSSFHDVIVEVSFKGRPVPDGTAVFISLGGKNPEKIIIENTTIFTQKQIISDITDEIRSYAILRIYPINSLLSFESQIQFETNFDKRGDATRSQTRCLKISYDAEKIEQEDTVTEIKTTIKSIYRNDLYVYDTLNNTWNTQKGLLNARGCLSLNWVIDGYGEQLFAIGGIDGNSLLASVEMYDVGGDIWTQKQEMNYARFYHTSVYDGSYIYVFGGFSIDDNNNLYINKFVERYDVVADEWEIVGEMPAFGEDSYATALSSSQIVNGKIYIVGGIRRIGNAGRIEEINDRILVFDIFTLDWAYSDEFVDFERSLYCRISPFTYVNTNADRIHVTGGSIPGELNQQTGEQPLEYLTDSFFIDIANLQIQSDDQSYVRIPEPRYRGSSASINDNHYFIGGSNQKSSVLDIVEKIVENTPSNLYNRVANLPIGLSSFGCTTDDYRYIYVCGGLSSGRAPGFLQIKAYVTPDEVRLDGKQSCVVVLELLNDVGERPDTNIKVIVQGYIKFKSAAAASESFRNSLVYPVVFSQNEFFINNGYGSTTLLPRSVDVLKTFEEIDKRLKGDSSNVASQTIYVTEGKRREDYSIQIKITITDSFYYGQTVIDIVDENEPNQPQPGSIPPANGEPSAPGGLQNPSSPDASQDPRTGTQPSIIEFPNCVTIPVNKNIPTSENGINPPVQSGTNKNNRKITQTVTTQDNPVFDLNPSQIKQFVAPEIKYFDDISWIPQSKILITNTDYEGITPYLNTIRYEIPFGGSPLYTALVNMSEILLDASLDNYAKSIYVCTDNEENLSLYTLEEAIESIQAIDGVARTPVIVNNFSVVFPLTLSALINRTDLNDLQKLSSDTGGQSQTVLSASFINQTINNSLGRLQGSIGYGLYECIIDLGEQSLIKYISADYELFSNTDGNWAIATSEDGYSYSNYTENYSANEKVDFIELKTRYLKFKIVLLSGLSASIEDEYAYIPTPGVPALTGINISYNKPSETIIILNKENTVYGAQQISVSVTADLPDSSVLRVGATTSNSTNWQDYYSIDQPSSERFGKIFIPVRERRQALDAQGQFDAKSQQSYDNLLESLDYVDGYIYRARYGSWDYQSQVKIYDVDMNLIDSSTYKTYPSLGLIVFKDKQQNLKISILNTNNLTVGVQVINYNLDQETVIRGLGFMYNTNKYLPANLVARAPEVRNPSVSPEKPYIYDTINVTYQYFDLNMQKEDTDLTEIKWYINGIHISYLDNLRTWNDINDFNDPLWLYGFDFQPKDIPNGQTAEQYAIEKSQSLIKTDDIIHATIKVSDGNFTSDVTISNKITVVKSPPYITSLTIKGKDNNGKILPSINTSIGAIADYGIFEANKATDTLKSQVVWYVNGFEFKRGNLGESKNGIPNDEIVSGEVYNGIIAIRLGNVLSVQIIPAVDGRIGKSITSADATVVNSPPSVIDVLITPNPRVSARSSLSLNYTYVDTESVVQDTNQYDRSTIKWYSARAGSTQFEEVTSLANVKLIDSVNLAVGQRWYAEVTPFDGLDVGNTVRSNTVTIIV